MTALAIIHAATAAGIALGVIAGKMVASSPTGPPPAALHAAIRTHKRAVLACLDEYATNGTMRAGYASRVAHLPALTDAARNEADHLAKSGGLGQFACDLCAGWNDLSGRDRLAAVTAWQLVAQPFTMELAA